MNILLPVFRYLLATLFAFFFFSANAQHVYYVALNGNDLDNGTKLAPLRTLQAASNRALSGDSIIVHGGIYREEIHPPRGGVSDQQYIVYLAGPGEHVEIRGSEIVRNWKKQRGFWKLSLPNVFFKNFNPYKDIIHGDWFDGKGWNQHTGAVYLNGRSLRESPTLNKISIGMFWYTKTTSDSTFIWANFGNANPNKELTEINVRQSVFYPSKPGINYITVSGFIMKHAATNWAPPTAEQVGLIGTNWSKGWIIENCDISYSKCAGITLGKYGDEFDNTSANSAEGYVETVKRALAHGWNKETVGGHIVRNNTISYCEQAGIAGSLGCSYSTITGNTIHDIHMLRSFSGAEMGAIKFHGAVDMTISNNKIYHNNRGIWLDWMGQGTRITGNLLYDHDEGDLFFEVDHGPIIVDNNVMLSKLSQKVGSQGIAYIHNLIAGSFEVWQYDNRQTPILNPHETSIKELFVNPCGDLRLYNNIFCGKDCDLTVFNKTYLPVSMAGNLYVNGAVKAKIDSASLEVNSGKKVVIFDDQHRSVLIDYPAAASHLNNQLISTGLLGKTSLTKEGFENPDGTLILFDTDFYGRRRKGKLKAGPYN